ncbi:limonene-1,2-epoxide hydrolase [Frankia sp. CcI49]|uniref:ester cyclase n=1 Tax=unclassified Frankia TaxID=2632575 RepID=UPI0006CA0062|nr:MULTISPECIES: ester cyclase [unclassified Frankia]KPM51633.1 limonene-1,2-epoxide hydrolase [Frankia sp. R43]ONH59256.1 limonene-1,2-epoxide hydrolase [Frankia sp. CcI49]
MGDALDTVKRVIAAFEAGDRETLLGLLAENVVMEAPGAVRLVGRAAALDHSDAFLSAFEDVDVDTHLLVEQGPLVVEESTLRARHTGPYTATGGESPIPASGNLVTLRIVEVYQVAGGLVTENRIYFDETGLRRQLRPDR